MRSIRLAIAFSIIITVILIIVTILSFNLVNLVSSNSVIRIIIIIIIIAYYLSFDNYLLCYYIGIKSPLSFFRLGNDSRRPYDSTII